MKLYLTIYILSTDMYGILYNIYLTPCYGALAGAGAGTVVSGNGQLPSYGGQFGTASPAGG